MNRLWASAVVLTWGVHSTISYTKAKSLIYNEVFVDANRDIYCDCAYDVKTRQINPASCLATPTSKSARSKRVEVEHIVPVYWLGYNRQCWTEPLCHKNVTRVHAATAEYAPRRLTAQDHSLQDRMWQGYARIREYVQNYWPPDTPSANHHKDSPYQGRYNPSPPNLREQDITWGAKSQAHDKFTRGDSTRKYNTKDKNAWKYDTKEGKHTQEDQGGYGGRHCCAQIDPEFRRAHNDLHNMAPALGDINSARQTYRYGIVSPDVRPSTSSAEPCGNQVDRDKQLFEPRAEIRGDVARAWLYMSDEYRVELSGEERQMYERWNRQDPPTRGEKIRNLRIEQLQGNRNPYVGRTDGG